MDAVIALGVALALAVWLGFSVNGRAMASPAEPSTPPAVPAAPPSPPAEPVKAETVSKLSRSEVQRLLQRLLSEPPPPQAQGAMCYAPLPPKETADYVCPACGEKTVYAGKDVHQPEEALAARRAFESLKAVAGDAVAMDETTFCRKCRPEARRGVVTLTIRYDDGTTVRQTVTASEIGLLTNLLRGDLSQRTWNDGQEPLQPQVPKLEKLTGVQAKP